MQRDMLVVTRPEQARALWDGAFLGRFLDPASPSDIARVLGIPANLAHHHAKRHAALGLLIEVRREQGKVLYQLAARTFKHDRKLLAPGEPDEFAAMMLGLLNERFLAEYQASDHAESGNDPDWHMYSFVRDEKTDNPLTARQPVSFQPRPAHFQARTLSLTSTHYRELVSAIARLISEAEAGEAIGSAGAKPCTLTFLAMDGVLQEGVADGEYKSSFMPADNLLTDPEADR